jgi:L-lactate dehydrogenase (cytochrome)
MDDMKVRKAFLPTGQTPRFQHYLKHFPTSSYLRRHAPRNVPFFASEYADTGAGDDIGVQHNWAAFDNVKIVPRYGVMGTLPPVGVELFGTHYSAPIGIAPMGAPAFVWPGADILLAKAAQAARVPYTLGVAGGATIEEIAKVAPDVFWLQLYRFANNDHKIGFDLIERAQRANVKVLTMTLDTPVRTTRSRETYAGLGREFQPTLRMAREMLVRPKWLLAMLRNGFPRFATMAPYAGVKVSVNGVIDFARREMGGAFLWDEVARYRDRWKGPMTVKGILHPADAEKAVSLGIEGIWISNHGGRQIEALVPPIDVLPAIAAAVGSKTTILLDSGIRSGQDVMRSLALGADAAFAGKSFLWSLGALGDDGPGQLIDLYIDELRSALGQIGAQSPGEARLAKVLHPGRIEF